jgi:hypothetical protein
MLEIAERRSISVAGKYGRRALAALSAWCCAMAISGGAPARGDLLVAGYEPRLHDRFYVGPDRAFIGEALSWSGYGRMYDPVGSGGSWPHLTMISDNWFISANHFHPIRGDDPAGSMPKARFYRTNDASGQYWETELAVNGAGTQYIGQRIGNTDLWVGKLANTPPDWVTRYPLAKRHEATNWLSYAGNEIYILGQDSPRNLANVRVGRNLVSELNVIGNYGWTYDLAGGLGADEAQTQGGDSGAPSFFISGNTPVLAGIHTRVNYDTGVSMHLDAIRAAVGEPISVSTGLIGDLNGDFRVNFADLQIIAANSGRFLGVRYMDGDLNVDGRVDPTDLTAFVTNYGKSLFAPTDFDRDGDVDGSDLAIIGENWLKPVSAPFTNGDADGNLFVNYLDLREFDRNERRAIFGPTPPPLSPVLGDADGNGILDGLDLAELSTYMNQVVSPGMHGDSDFDGLITGDDLTYLYSNLGSSFGDITNDKMVGPADFFVMAWFWNRQVAGGRSYGDMNSDGVVNAVDARILFDWWSVTATGFPSVTAPEPGALVLGLVGFAVFAASCRFRRAAAG